MGFPNKAGDHADTDSILRAELAAAGIPTLQQHEGKPPEYMADFLRETSGEVKTSVVGTLHGWTFKRAWYYWTAKGPGIEVAAAERLHAAHGRDVRVDGHCGCPSPTEQYKGLAVGNYHVDTPAGLKALADTIKALVERAVQPTASPSGAGLGGAVASSEAVDWMTRTSDYSEGYRDGYAKGLVDDREYTYRIGRMGGISRPEMHPATADLVMRFGDALRDKLAAAEKRYGYSDGWLQADWMDECRAKLLEHVAKGDPRDVAAYCAFLWHHGESTAAPRAALASQPGCAVEGEAVTDAMVDAYLKANDAYWKRTDELPKSGVKWRNGTPREATRESLIAALQANSTEMTEGAKGSLADGKEAL